MTYRVISLIIKCGYICFTIDITMRLMFKQYIGTTFTKCTPMLKNQVSKGTNISKLVILVANILLKYIGTLCIFFLTH